MLIQVLAFGQLVNINGLILLWLRLHPEVEVVNQIVVVVKEAWRRVAVKEPVTRCEFGVNQSIVVCTENWLKGI